MAGIIINMSNDQRHTGECGDEKKLGNENMKRSLKTNVKLCYLLYIISFVKTIPAKCITLEITKHEGGNMP